MAVGGDCKNSALLFTSMMKALRYDARVDCNVEHKHCVTYIPYQSFSEERDQYAIADFLQNEANYLEISNLFQEKKDFFHNLMSQTRFDLLTCHGSYFQTVQYKRISDEKDTELTMRLIKEFGVACIPVSAFYSKGTDQHVLRFCFAKKKETLEKAVNCLIKV
jgi:aspartate/methionine/tyrosine aminotransferase